MNSDFRLTIQALFMNSVLFGVLLGGGHARAVLATSLLHIHAHLHLVDDRDEDGHHISVSGRGIVRPRYR